jgi:hypothetical protein
MITRLIIRAQATILILTINNEVAIHQARIQTKTIKSKRVSTTNLATMITNIVHIDMENVCIMVIVEIQVVVVEEMARTT